MERDEAFLWPDLALRNTSMLAASAEIHEAYAHRADLAPDEWWRLFSGATRRIDLLGCALLHLTENHPRLPDLLLGKAADGCSVRIALADPDCAKVAERDDEEGLDGGLAARIRTSIHYLEPLAERSGIELRLHAAPMYNSIFRFDDQMLVTPHLYGRPGRLAPLLHLRRRKDGGMFDNFATHFEDVWTTAAPHTPEAGR